ncbi:MAG TPA: alpha/beta hydrolase [Acidimicrobiia bacterium]|nr:alpha/beta hydrolase [Acidimicrobiia bacterium]
MFSSGQLWWHLTSGDEVTIAFLGAYEALALTVCYSKLARGGLPQPQGFIRARDRYPGVCAPVTLVYGDRDWSRPAERDQVSRSLARVERITLPRTGHFSALERPVEMAKILLGELAS